MDKNNETGRLLGKLAELCHQISEETKADCFVHYNGAMKTFEVLCYKDGWSCDTTPEAVAQFVYATAENIVDAIIRLSVIWGALGVRDAES